MVELLIGFVGFCGLSLLNAPWSTGIHDARNFDEYTQVLAGDTTNKMAYLGGEEGASLCIALLCTIVLRRRLSSKKRSIWARKWLRRRRWDVFL
jgi:hypothetical protein